jgi:hypothetical protein
MQLLKFKLISNSNTLINKKTNYYIKDNIINFKIDNDIYTYNKESIITIDFENYNIIIEIPECNSMFNMEIKEYNIHIDNDNISIKYKYIADEIMTNSIFIQY